MSLKLGFVQCETRATPWVFTFTGLVLLGMLILLVSLLLSRFTLAERNVALTERQDELQDKVQRQSVELENAPSLQEFRQLQQRIAAINTLAGRQGAGLSVMLSRMEELLPAQAYVTSLVYRPAANELRLTLEAPGAEQLTGLLQAAENSGHFNEVQLSRQSQEKRGGQRVIQFEIRLRAEGGRG